MKAQLMNNSNNDLWCGLELSTLQKEFLTLLTLDEFKKPPKQRMDIYDFVRYFRNRWEDVHSAFHKRLYFENENSTYCHRRGYFLEQMKRNKVKEMVVFMAKPIRDDSRFFCDKTKQVLLKRNNHCGLNNCAHYKPRNGTSGACKMNIQNYVPSKKIVLFNL